MRKSPLSIAAVLLAVGALSAGAVGAPTAASGPPQRPNIVVIMTDDQTAASLPTMQHVNALLAGEGTKFDQAIDSFPLCCPSRATNLTGQYAHNHGVLHNAPPFGGGRARRAAGERAPTRARSRS